MVFCSYEDNLKICVTRTHVMQTAWVQNLTIKDNILFGKDFNESHYREVIHACALELDLQMLPQGDQSMGGLRGMNLSGGQRQRVNIARAAYFDGDTILLDNALSAVDHHTADHIFEHCIKDMFKDKAVVLVTHQLCVRVSYSNLCNLYCLAMCTSSACGRVVAGMVY